MNLALECLGEFSDLGFKGLVARVEPTMPRHFLLSTAELQPSLGSRRTEIAEIAEAMDNGSDLPASRNPEVYAQIALLAQAAGRGGDPSSVLELLRVQLGLVEFADARLRDGIFRLVHVDGTIRARRSSHVERLEDEIVESVAGLPARVLLPYRRLYQDLVSPELYRDDVGRYDRAGLGAKVSAAVDLLERYSPEIAADLRDVIRTVVLVPDLRDARQWSYNLRLAYFGAVFVNAFAVERHGMAEALMHEYFHQRLWQWWTYERPSGLPPESVLIRSPITNREKPAIVMLQALLIYVSAQRLYADVASGDESLTPEERRWVEQRASSLSAAIPDLHRALVEHVPDETTGALIIDRAMELFAEPVR